jgi:carbamoyltransferase
MNRPVYVLGTGLSHDGSACLLKDGRIAVAIEKERITRRKHDGGNDTDAIRYCLDAAGITLEDLSLIVQNANFGDFERGNDWFGGQRLLTKDCPVPVVTVSHHLAHAYSALGMCPFEECNILVVDGCGNGADECKGIDEAAGHRVGDDETRHLFFEKDSYYSLRDGKLSMIYKDFSPWGLSSKGYPLTPNTTKHSIGGVYAAASSYCLRGREDLGKLMGLAPYGRPDAITGEIFDLRDGRVFVLYDWMKEFDRPARSDSQFCSDFQYYADIARWVQRELERALLYLIESRLRMSPCDYLAYAGGVALNAVANSLIHRHFSFKDLFIVPAAGDNGVAVGCAFYGWLEILKQPRLRHCGSTCFGRTYPTEAVRATLDAAPIGLSTAEPQPGTTTAASSQDLRVQEAEDFITVAAQLLADGKIIAWFQDGSEFGPRALGRRSLLADPGSPGVRDVINREIKRREDFRPFAPSVLREDAATFFDGALDSPYMILVAQVRPAWAERLRSVVHEDGSARIQTVTEDWNSKYYRLLAEFRRLSGISVLLNTSFNRRGMPIVETPEQALSFFCETPRLDALVIDRFIVTRAEAGRGVP